MASPKKGAPPETIERLQLDLSGPALSRVLAAVIAGCEPLGGVERYVTALRLKSKLFQDVIPGRVLELEAETFVGLSAFMPTVRRRIACCLEDERQYNDLLQAITCLLTGAKDTTTTDARLQTFCAAFPNDKGYRWVRDLAAELLHNIDPERYPLMCRWVWDVKANTGVLREIWHGDDVDSRTLKVADNYQTFVLLRQELSQYLTDNGVFRDVLFYVDLLCAQIYAEYVCAQGGSYLRADFSEPEDPMQHTRRLLGLDGVSPRGRIPLKTVNGGTTDFENIKLLD